MADLDLTEAIDALYDWLWEPSDPQPRESCAKVVDDIAVIIERQVRQHVAELLDVAMALHRAGPRAGSDWEVGLQLAIDTLLDGAAATSPEAAKGGGEK